MCFAPLQALAKAPVAKSRRVRGVGLEEEWKDDGIR